MALVTLITIALVISLIVMVFALGLSTKLDDVTFLLRRPGLLLRSILAMNVIMLGFAVALSKLFDLDPAIEIAVIALALSPVPPLLPGKQISTGGTASYAVGLLVAAAVISIVLVPLSVELLEYVFPFELHIGPERVATGVGLSIFAPLAAGVAIARFAPGFAQRAAPFLSRAASLLLIAALIPFLVTLWSDFAGLFGQGVVLCLVLFTAVGIAVGHILGGPVPADRTSLALATGTRHPGIAAAFASINFPEQGAVLALIIYHLVISGIVAMPYIRWRVGKLVPAGREVSDPDGSDGHRR